MRSFLGIIAVLVLGGAIVRGESANPPTKPSVYILPIREDISPPLVYLVRRGVKEAMEKSMAEGSQSFEHDIARLIVDGLVDRKEGLAHADSPTNLMWRMQNDFVKAAQPAAAQEEEEHASFTEITLDVKH